MALPPGFLDELRSRVSLAGLIGRRVKLIRRGREYAGLCPFHHEKTPSFYVVEDKGFFHCFGCGAHGDAIGFAMRTGNLDFIEAVEKLAGEAGIAVPQASREERQQAQRQKTLLDALDAAARFYEVQLWAPSGRGARDYLRSRGLDEDTMRRFRLGWAPDDRHALRRALAGDFPEALLVEAGLLRRPEESEAYDYFRGRILFPIGDRAGRIIAFGGRVLGDGQPKYLNSPDTPVFAKGRVLYGWAAARAAVARNSADGAGASEIVVTEGYMDVIALHRAGFAGAVAPLGTALTETQLAELWRLAREPVLCFDGDAAGQRAAVRAMRRALPLLQPGNSLRFVALPAGDDPDSLIRAGGRESVAELIAAARPLAAMLWQSETGLRAIDTPERRADLRRRLDELVATIENATVREEYRRFMRNRLFEQGWQARPGAARGRGRGPVSTAIDASPPPPRPAEYIQRQLLFRILLRFPQLIDEVAEEFTALDLPETPLDGLRRAILEVSAGHPALDAQALRQHLVRSGFAAAMETLDSPSVDTGFLVRCPDSVSARKVWMHVIRMLTGADRSGLAEARHYLQGDVSAENWARLQPAIERALQEDLRGEDEA